MGTPLMRPLWMEFPHQEGLLDSQRSFMLGPALLVAPVLDEVRGGWGMENGGWGWVRGSSRVG